MAEYIGRDSVLNIVKGNWSFMNSADDAIQTSIEMIRRLPAADVVEVIRCKDCRFFTPSVYSDDWCSAKSPGVSKGMYTPSGDSYCSDAERMTDDV